MRFNGAVPIVTAILIGAVGVGASAVISAKITAVRVELLEKRVDKLENKMDASNDSIKKLNQLLDRLPHER